MRDYILESTDSEKDTGDTGYSTQAGNVNNVIRVKVIHGCINSRLEERSVFTATCKIGKISTARMLLSSPGVHILANNWKIGDDIEKSQKNYSSCEKNALQCET